MKAHLFGETPPKMVETRAPTCHGKPIGEAACILFLEIRSLDWKKKKKFSTLALRTLRLHFIQSDKIEML